MGATLRHSEEQENGKGWGPTPAQSVCSEGEQHSYSFQSLRPELLPGERCREAGIG